MIGRQLYLALRCHHSNERVLAKPELLIVNHGSVAVRKRIWLTLFTFQRANARREIFPYII